MISYQRYLRERQKKLNEDTGDINTPEPSNFQQNLTQDNSVPADISTPSDVSGNTISEIIASAGGDLESVDSIIQIIKDSLQKTDLKLTDNNFLR